MNLSLILGLLGPEIFIDAYEDKLCDALVNPECITPELTRISANLLLQDSRLISRLERAVEGNVLREDIIQGIAVFIREYGQASNPSRIYDFERHFGLTSSKKDISADLDLLTASQRVAFREICALSEIYFAGESSVDGISLRFAPLVIGPSGVGKTHVVTAAARALNLPIIRMTVSDWLVQAGKQSPCAYDVLRMNLSKHNRIMLFIDELDKMSIIDGGSDYARVQHAEIYAALDRSIHVNNTGASAWTNEHAYKLRHNVMIVGGGTWHELWRSSNRRSMGFSQTEICTDEAIVSHIRQSRIIPDELLNRFSDRWLLLRPYSVDDFKSLAQRARLTPDEFDPVAAAASGRNFREIQNALTARALKRYFSQNPAL